MLRELTDPQHRAMCDLWATTTGRDSDDDEIRLTVFATLGQILYFHIAELFVGRRMAWDHVGTVETGKIVGLVRANLRDSIERLRL